MVVSAVSVVLAIMGLWSACTFLEARHWGAEGAINISAFPDLLATCPITVPNTFIAYRRYGDAYELRRPTRTGPRASRSA